MLFRSSYYARVADLESNPRLSDIHFVHQNYVRDMVKSVGLVALAFVSKRNEKEYFIESKIVKEKNSALNSELISKDLNLIDTQNMDSDFVDLLEYILKYEPSSAVELSNLLTDEQYTKMMTSMRDSHLVCPDPENARKMFMEMKGQTAYDPNFAEIASLGGRAFIGPSQQGTNPGGFSAFNVFNVMGSPIQTQGNDPFAPLRDPTDNKTHQFSVKSTNLAPASEIKVLKEYTIGHETKKENLPLRIDLLNNFSAIKPKVNGEFSSKDKDVQFIKKFMVNPGTTTSTPLNLREPKAIEREIKVDYSKHVPQDQSKNLCGCFQTAACHCHTHHHRLPGHMHLHYDNPAYSTYSHMYYTGRPLQGKDADLLHVNPVPSK